MMARWRASSQGLTASTEFGFISCELVTSFDAWLLRRMTPTQQLVALALALGWLSAQPLTSVAGEPSDCEPINIRDATKMKALIEKFGGEEFRDPISVRPTSEAAKHDLVVHYAANRIVGCDAKLRSYNGKVVGETIYARPGDTLHLRLVNALPPVGAGLHKHPQDPPPAGHSHNFSFNVTNLHTHGLHTAPQGPKEPGSDRAQYESDNVLVVLAPGEQQEYRIHIHDKHPTGTFWYHAHLHGSTALQLASGMGGALIVEDGAAENGDLDTIPAIKAAKPNEKVFVLQQFGYDKAGTLEPQPIPPSTTPLQLRLTSRPTLINGQLVPKIRMRPGEVQRWRFIHAGTQENIALAVDGHPLHEVAADGLSLGRSVRWPDAATADAAEAPEHFKLVLAPGYRTDVLIKAELEPGQSSRRVFLRDLRLSNTLSLRAAEAFNLRAVGDLAPTIAGVPIEITDKPAQVLAEIVIGGAPVAMDLPTAEALASVKPMEFDRIAFDRLQASDPQPVELKIARDLTCKPDGSCLPCTTGDPECRKLRYLIDNKQFSDGEVRKLKLDTYAEWTLSGRGLGGFERHPFHIHVNPFYSQRAEPDGTKQWIWKDTLLVPPPGSLGGPEKVWMKYTRFTGKFVIHCHILTHEDRGMMQLVEIIPP
jgi:FtsP/CotA-like multicopper oxidase with cupredoxin domain